MPIKKIIFILTLFPFFTTGQNTYTGLYGAYNHKWTLKINPDSSIFLIKNVDNNGYEEYTGKISKINDTLFSIKLHLDYAQCTCRAVGDSMLYVSLDTVLSKSIKQVSIVYSNSEALRIPVNDQKKLTIPLKEKPSPTESKTDFFYFTSAHKNPIDNSEVKTHYKIKDELCVELFQGNGGMIRIVMKGDTLQKNGNGVVDNFILTKLTK